MMMRIKLERKFEEWWEASGKMFDPDVDTVPWFDKRKELAAYAFEAGSRTREITITKEDRTGVGSTDDFAAVLGLSPDLSPSATSPIQCGTLPPRVDSIKYTMKRRKRV